MDFTRRDLAITFGLIAVYLSLMTTLALTVDRGFFLNDVVALVTWVILGLFLVASGARLARR